MNGSPHVTIYSYGSSSTLCALKRGAQDEPQEDLNPVNVFQAALSRTGRINREYLGCSNPETGKDILDRKAVWYIPSADELELLYSNLKTLNCRIRLMQKVSENAGNTEEFYLGYGEDWHWLPYSDIGGTPCIFVHRRDGVYEIPNTNNQTYGVSSSTQLQSYLFIDPEEYSEIAKDSNRCKK